MTLHDTQGPVVDAVEELDWMTGKVLEALDAATGVKDNTLVIWTSDNGE